MSIKTKVLVAPLAVTALLAAVAAVSVGLLRSQGEAFRDVVGTAFDAATTTSRLSLAVSAIHSDILRQIDPQQSAETDAELKALAETLQGRFDRAEAMLQSLEANAQFLDANLLHAVSDFLGIYRIVATRVTKGGGRNPTLVSSLMAHYSQLDAFLSQLAEATIRAAKDKHQKTQAFVGRSVEMLLAAVALTLALAIAATWFFGRAIAAPLTDMAAKMERLAGGDHAIAIPATTRGDEVGSMARSLAVFRTASANLHQRETELAQMVARLAELRDRADEASRAKSAFLASMSHELRTPLNAILGYAQVLRRDRGLDARHLAGLQTIQTSGQFLLLLINDILDLAKIEAGKLELYPATVDLPGLLQIVSDIIRIRAEQRGLRFALETVGSLPCMVLADEKRLRQILLNLLGNAVKFTERGTVTLRVIRLAAPGELAARLCFEVIDTGVGIAEAHLQRIFQPFEQACEAQSRIGGTGLGLTISRQLVRLMNSEIAVASEPGRGSRFSFELDLLVSSVSAPSRAAERMPDGYRGRRRRVLVADDIAENRAVVRDLLGALGFHVVEATNGLDAVEKARSEAPDLIVMDVVMPVMDGLAAIGKLRALGAFAALPIIAVSASTSKSDAQRTLAVGANLFLPKPLDLARFLEESGRLLDLEWTYDAPRPEAHDAPRAAPELAEGPVGLTAELRDRLVRALVELDAAGVARAIEAIRSEDPAAAGHLARLADEFQYDDLLQWIGRAHAARQGESS